MKQEDIEKAIRETLVVENKQSIHHAVNRIMKLQDHSVELITEPVLSKNSDDEDDIHWTHGNNHYNITRFDDGEFHIVLTQREGKGFLKFFDPPKNKYSKEDLIKCMFMATKWDTFKEGDVEYKMNMDEFFEYILKSIESK